jgi:S-adenosylmethionine decarboxylase
MKENAGLEWIIEAFGCDRHCLAGRGRLEAFVNLLIAEMRLHPVAPAVWYAFPGTGGITGFCMLAESHLAWHTFPEHGSLCLNLFCCRPRPDWDFEGNLKRELGASEVRVRRVERPFTNLAALAASPARL